MAMAMDVDAIALAGVAPKPTGLVNWTNTNTVTQAPATADFDDVLDAITECRKDHVEPTAWIISATNMNVLNKLKINSETHHYLTAPPDVAKLQKFTTEGIGNNHIVVGDFSSFYWALRQDIMVKRESEITRNSQLVSVTVRMDVAAAHGHFVHAFVERASNRPVPIPVPIRAALERILVKA
jgi:HK97 family phage major capsid protein